MEQAALESAASALDLPLSRLIGHAAIEAAFKLGYTYGTQPTVRARPGSWRDAPRRDEGDSATIRLSVTLDSVQLSIVQQVVSAQDVSIPAFLIGSTLRFIATQRDRAPKGSPLAGIRVPKQYA